MTRIEERVAIVNSEVENQLRDQNTCLELLHQHVAHADDLLKRAARCSKIPDDAYRAVFACAGLPWVSEATLSCRDG
jgi:hypothetical protein